MLQTIAHLFPQAWGLSFDTAILYHEGQVYSYSVVFKVLFSALNFYSSKLWEGGQESEEA
jgi:hypothetical protein